MRKKAISIFMVSMVTFLIQGFQLEAFSVEEETLTIKGVIIDNRCVDLNKNNLADFVKTHTKQCALMTACVASGYSVYSDGKIQKFDEPSNKKIVEFLKKSDSKLQVVINAKKSGELISLVSIENQK